VLDHALALEKRGWLARLCGHRQNDIATVEKSQIEGYLAEYTGRNQLNHLRALNNFFRFTAKIGAIATVPTSGIDISFRRSKVAYLDNKVFADLLTKAYDQNEADILAWLVLGGFLGLRPFEAYHAYWFGVKWETSEFRVEAEWSRIRRSRVLPVQPNAMGWLRIACDLRQRDNQILPNYNTFTHRFVAWRETNHDMAFWKGKRDVLRHSYGTHRMAIARNAHQVAEEMGNSVAIVRRHYDASSGTFKGECMVGNPPEGVWNRCCRNSLRSSSPASKFQITNRASTTPVSFGGREKRHWLDNESLQFVWISRNASLS
jgi:site-specific recombinase XerC